VLAIEFGRAKKPGENPNDLGGYWTTRIFTRIFVQKTPQIVEIRRDRKH
jgi:hypothetical protein